MRWPSYVSSPCFHALTFLSPSPMQWNQLATLAFSVLGTIGLVLYTFVLLRLSQSIFAQTVILSSRYPLLGVIFVPIIIFYVGFATFYRASSREVRGL